MSGNIVYLHGFASGPGSRKAAFFRERIPGLKAPDLARGNFEGLTITGQLEVVAEAAGTGPVDLIGSSMGGYLAALYAARRPEVRRLVLMAPAFAFARRWAEYLGPGVLREWQRTGTLETWNYARNAMGRVGWQLMEDARRYEDFPAFAQPALILHGSRDTVVPPESSRIFAEGKANIRLVPLDSDHELSDVLERMWEEAARFLGSA